jgi:outer membrane protein assembly factor BamA
MTVLAAIAAILLAAEPGAVDTTASATATPTPTSTSTSTATATAEPDREPTAARAYLVERITFSGLSHVREWAARLHLTVHEGQTLDEQKVLVSRLRLLQLGWFSSVETRIQKGSARGQVVVVFEVVERNTLLLTDLVVGTTGPQPFYGGLGLTQHNFLGQGLTLGGALVWGGTPSGRPADPSRFAARGAFYAPDVALLGYHFVAGVSALWLRGEEFACPDASCQGYSGRFQDAPRWRYRRGGGEVMLGLRPGPFERVSASYRWEQLSAVADPGAGGPVGEAPPTILPGDSTLGVVTTTWEFDDRNDLFFPTHGLLALAQVSLSSRLVGSDYEYSRYVLQLETGFGLGGLPLRFQGFVGAAQGGAPFFERFYAADLSYFAVGPAQGRALELNFSTDSRYDAFAAMAGAEYAIPLWSRGGFFRRGYLSLGARAVWSSATLGGRRTPFTRWPVSLDAALRFDTPVGTFNASLGAALDNLL